MNELIKHQQTTQETEKQAISSSPSISRDLRIAKQKGQGSFEKPLDLEAQMNIRHQST